MISNHKYGILRRLLRKNLRLLYYLTTVPGLPGTVRTSAHVYEEYRAVLYAVPVPVYWYQVLYSTGSLPYLVR